MTNRSRGVPINPRYNVPKPYRVIRLAIAVPSEIQPNSRSNGRVYLATSESSLIIGSSAMYSRSPGIS